MNWLLVFFIAIVILWLLLQWIQLRILFYPSKNHTWTPDDAEELNVGGLNGWYFRNSPTAKTILHCHGNAGNISHLRHIITLCKKQKLNLVVYDYSGYGKSAGSASPSKVCDNGDTMYNYVTTTLGVHPDNLILWGESLGGAVATHIASTRDCSSLVLLATFSSLDDILLDTYPGLSSSLGCYLLRGVVNVMPSKEKISAVKCPIIILHSQQDEVIPYTNALRMFKTIPHPCKKFIEIEGAHAFPKLTGEILKEVLSFCCTDITQCYCVDELLEDIGNGKARPNLAMPLL